jgi:hypothetical protein
VGAIEAAVKLLADRTAAIVIALKGHPDQVRRQKTIGAWKAIVHARELQRTQKRYALVTMCVGVGQGYAAILEKA